MYAKCKVFSFVSFKILITPYLLPLTLPLSHIFCHATCRYEHYWKLVFYILQSLQYILIPDAWKAERYLNYIHKTSFSTTNIAQSTSIKKTKMRVTFKEKRVCGNKMPTRCNRCFLLQILLLAQHVSGTIISIISCSSSQTGHITLSSTPYRRLENQSTQIPQAATTCIILSSS